MRITLLAGALASALVATSAAAQFGPFVPPFSAQPSKDDLEAAYPAQAAPKDLSGVAVATCTVTADKALEGCKLVQETPVGFGFGKALLAVAPKYRISPKLP